MLGGVDCSRCSQVVEWGALDATGKPVASAGCFNCMNSDAVVNPKRGWELSCQQFQSDPKFRATMLKASQVFAGKVEPERAPATSVDTVKSNGYTIYHDLAILTEADVMKHFKVPPAALKLSPCLLSLENGSASETVFLINGQGMPSSVWDVSRKLRVWRTITVQFCEHVMQPESQLMQVQGPNTYEVFRASELASRPEVLVKRSSAFTFESPDHQ